jgi:hypothetical protein
MKKCEKCGQQYNDKMKFCVVCGAELTDADVAVAPEEAVEATAVESAAVEATIVEEPATEEVIAEEPKEEIFTEEFPPETAVEEATAQEVIAEETAEEDPAEVTETAAEESEAVIEEPETEETLSDDVTEIPIKEAKPKITAGRVVAGIFSGLLGVVCFALLLFAGVSYTARYFSFGESIESIVTSIDILNLPLDNTPMSGMGDTVLAAVYASSDGMGLSEEDIKTIYQEATFRDELINIISAYTNFIRTGEYSEAITTETIKAIYEDNLVVINRVLERAGGSPITEHDRILALASIDSADAMLDSISFDNISKSDGLINPVGLVRIALSFEAIVGEVAIALILMLIIGLLCKSVRTPLVIGGLSFLLSGGIIAAALFLFEKNAIRIVDNHAIQTIFADVARFLGGQIYLVCAGAAAVGIVMLIISAIKPKPKKAIA